MAAKSSYSGLDQLLAQQSKVLESTNNQRKQLETYLSDYANVKSKLTDYPTKVIKRANIPFGPKAFAPGYFQHTNEVYALLGDNYFAFVSAVQAEKIVQRRMDKLNKDIDGLKAQNRLMQDRLNFTSQINVDAIKNEMTEIREEYDSDTEREWRVKHAQRLRNAVAKSSLDGAKTSSDTISDEALMRRLEQLEREEEKAERLNLIPALKTSSGAQMNSKKQVRFSGHEETPNQNESSSSEPLTDEEEIDSHSSRVIRFSHSSYQPYTPVQASGDSSFNSPGDIFDRYLSSDNPSGEIITTRPYSDVVMERDPNLLSTATSSTSRPKSKFSSMRSNR